MAKENTHEYRMLSRKRRYTPKTGWGEWGQWEDLKGYNRARTHNYASLNAVKIAMSYYKQPERWPGGVIYEREFRVQRRPISPDWEDVDV